MKKNFPALVAFGLVAGMCLLPVSALEGVPTPEDGVAITTTEENVSRFMDKTYLSGPNGSTVKVHSAGQIKTALIYGTLSKWEDTDRYAVYRVNDAGESEAQVVLTISEKTRILDAVTGEPVALADVREGEMSYVYTDAVMALSMPAQSGAQMILVNIPADFGVPSYVEVDTVKTNEDGTVVLGTDAGMNITLSDETTVSPYLTKNIVTKDMIQPGHKVLVWHGPVLESYPSQTTATKALVFAYDYEGYLSLNGDSLSIDGEAIAFTDTAKLKVDGEDCLVPLRTAVEALGYNVGWDGATRTVRVSQNGEELYAVALNAETVMVDGDERYLSRPVTTQDGVSYIALDDLIFLHDLKMETAY